MASSVGEQTLIFVYGTLKSGFPNNYLVQDLIRSNDAVPIPPPNNFQSVLPFPLVVGPFGIPYLLNFPGSGLKVRGELYSVSPRGLARLDDLEGVSYGHYQRLPIRVGGDGATAVEAEAYFGHSSFAEELWMKCGEGAAAEEYLVRDADKYVRPGDRPVGLNFLDNIHAYLASRD